MPLKATAWFAACQFLQRGIGLLTSPFVARMLPTEEYGRASLFSSWESILLVLVTLSSPHAVMNLCVKYGNRDRVLSGLLGYSLSVAAIWGIIMLVSMGWIVRTTGLSDTLVICLCLLSTFSSIIACWTYVNQYEYSYKTTVLVSLSYTLGTALSSLFAIAFISNTAEAKIIPQVFFAVATGLVILICSFRPGKVFYDREVWKFSFFFCVPLIPHYLFEILLMCSDRIMIDKMCGPSEVAIYSVAYTVGSLVLMIAGVIDSSFGSYQYHKISNKEYQMLARNTNYIMAFVALCLCGIMLFGHEIIIFWGGHKYIDSISLVIPISLGVFFNYVFRLFARVQEYFEQKHTIVIATVSCAVLNIILNYVFIRLYGYKAAAYTTFFCYFIFCALHYLFYRKACKKFVGQEIYDIKGLALISAILLLASVAIVFINKLFLLKYAIIVGASALMIWRRKRFLEFINIIRTRA